MINTNGIRMKHVGFSLSLSIFMLLSCQQRELKTSEAKPPDSAQASTVTTTESVRPVHWYYDKEGGPEGWAKLSPAYAACGAGQFQSPVDIVTKLDKASAGWKLEYKTSSLRVAHHEQVQELINNGHTIQITPEAGSSLNYNGKFYELKQFHFHTPSEHTINGKHAPMEIHFVHESADKSLAVVGVLVKEGKSNPNIAKIIKYLPNAVGEKLTHDSVQIDISLHVPSDLFAYHYVGSLTTPPCTENVQWLVLRSSVQMSREQIDAFEKRLHINNRPTQPLHQRKVTIDDIVSK